MANPTVFVCGATGAQGGHLARRLRAIGWGVHTTVRTPESPAAQSLSSIGVKITPGDWCVLTFRHVNDHEVTAQLGPPMTLTDIE